MPPHITIEDVARECGVSRQTVSRVLNNKGEIGEATAERVRAVIARLGYRPSSIARSLATSRTRTLGLVVPDVSNPFFAEIARGAEDAAHAADYGLLLCNTAEDPLREGGVLQMLEEKRVDGVVLCSSRLGGDELAVAMARFPAVVLVNRFAPSSDVRTVRVNDEEGSRLAVRHLLASGRSRIGFLSGPETSHSAQARRRGLLAALREAGVPDDPTYHATCLPYLEGSKEAAMALLARKPSIDALYCHNDLVAIGALQACVELGRRVPADVAVIGCDDIPLAALVTPSLTTLRVDKHAIGLAAVRLLLDQLGGCEGDCADIVVEPSLVVRASAPLAADAAVVAPAVVTATTSAAHGDGT